MSHADKLATVQALIEQHNVQVAEEDRINFDAFEKALKKAGGSTEKALKDCTWEDLEDCGLPKILARSVAAIFRTSATVETDNKYVSDKKAVRMTIRELIEAFDLNEPTSPIGKRLKELSNGHKFLAVLADGKIDVHVSTTELNDLRRGSIPREIVIIEGRPVQLREVGYRKAEMADENPIYKGLSLRSDGTCDQTNRSWGQVPHVVRQLVYLAINQTGECSVKNYDEAHNVLDRALQPNAEASLRQRYAKASTVLDELTEQGKAPTLKVPIGGVAKAKANDPFYSHQKF